MKKLIISLLLGAILPIAVALMLRYDYEAKLADFSTVLVKVQTAEIQPVAMSTKGLKQLTLLTSYAAFGEHYSWSAVLPLNRSQNERAVVLVDAAKNKGVVDGWVRKTYPDKLILFLPESPLNPLTYFYLMLSGFVVALMTMLAGTKLILSDSQKSPHG
jgi:hypothetical protein